VNTVIRVCVRAWPKGTQNILNVQPVLPIHINEDWNVITRTLSSACGDVAGVNYDERSLILIDALK
jgi:hypothetical protein